MVQKKYFLLLVFSFLYLLAFTQKTGYIHYKSIPDDGGDPPVANIDSVRSWVFNILHYGGGLIDTNSIRYVGDPRAFCYFWNGDGNWSELDWDTGLGLSTGALEWLETPQNTSGYADLVEFGTPGDTSLFKMYQTIFKPPFFDTVPTMSIHTGDAAYLEFTYQPYDTVISIDYIFASDEYPFDNPQYDANITDSKEWSIDKMNDFFGIFIGSPGAPADALTPLNVVPFETPQGTSNLPLCAATLNSTSNSEFFHANPPPLGPGFGHEFDGFTSVSPNADPPPPANREGLRTLRIEKKVTRCAKKTIKIAIEDYLYHFPDTSGFFINSTVFLKKGALRGGISKPGWKVTKKHWTGLGLVGKLIEPTQGHTEGCNELYLTYQLEFPPGGTDTIYPIPFTVTNNARNFIYVIDTTHNNDTLTVDTLYFGPTETIKTIRLVAHGLSFEQIKNCSFTYAANPCEFDNLFGGTFSGKVDLQLIDNSPIVFDFDPSPGYKQYDAYCKETIDLRIDSTAGQAVTHGGVKPLIYNWPGNPVPPVSIYSYTVNASPDFVPVTVNDRCLNESTTQVKIVNKPIILKGIQSIFLCGPGQEATVPVQTIMPNPTDMPGYSIDHVLWQRQTPPPVIQLGDQDGDSVTVVYDNVVGDNLWTCWYQATDVCGGQADSTFLVNQSSLVLENIGVCKGDPIELTTGTPAHWFKWYRKDGSTWTQIGTAQTTIDNSYPLGQPQITYKLEIEDNCGEYQEAEMTVYVDTYEPAVTYNPEDELCFGEDITLEANSSQSSTVSYTWLSGSDVVGNNSTITFGQTDYNTPGTYTYTLNTVSETQYFYCPDSTTATFTVHANPSAAFSIDPPQHACTNTPINFDYADDITNKTFLWDFDDGTTDAQPHTTHQYTNPGNYNVKLAINLTYPNPTGHICSSDSTVVLTVDPLPVPDFTANPVEGCEPLLVQFTDQSQDILSGATYDWQFGDGNSDNTTSPSHNYISYGKYPVTLTVSNTDRCNATVSKPDFITVNPNPVANFVADPWIATMDNPVIDFTDSTTVVEGGIDTYDWDFGDDNNSAEQNPQHTYGKAGDYTVTLLVSTDKNCPDTITKLVSITEFVKLYIPNAFYPSSAVPENRKFTIKGTAMDDFHLYIFDRYGQQIWSTHNFENYWDGTDANGNEVPAGSYIYKIEGTDYKKRVISYKGTVTIIR